MDASELDYFLPNELIAQHPAVPRDASRLVVYSRESGEVRHRSFGDLPAELPRETLAVVHPAVRKARHWKLLGGGEAPRTKASGNM